jgi:uncharacterized protein YbjT (DUF2867 family)
MGDHRIFLTGATGYIGSRLAPLLLAQGHQVSALARPKSLHHVPTGCRVVPGDALDHLTYTAEVASADTFIHLVGVAHPSPAKAQQFIDVDLRSLQEAAQAAQRNDARHFVYVSVAQPAPAMKAYVAARAKGEEILRVSKLKCTVLRPWYVLGPGHRWPYALLPFYKIAEWLPRTRESSRRLGLVTLQQMLAALTSAVANPANGYRIVEVPEIRTHLVKRQSVLNHTASYRTF